MKLAMLNVHRKLTNGKWKSKMLLQIHDELIFEVPPTEMETIEKLVHDEMTGVMPLSVPLKVDMKTGRNWAECE